LPTGTGRDGEMNRSSGDWELGNWELAGWELAA
jgi:hypothetical protein